VRPTGGYYGWPHIVVYDYSLNGISYQSSKIVFGDTLGKCATYGTYQVSVVYFRANQRGRQ
jgi:hypothetical protein